MADNGADNYPKLGEDRLVYLSEFRYTRQHITEINFPKRMIKEIVKT